MNGLIERTNDILTIAYFVCIAVAAYLLASAVTKCRSEKKNFFIFCLFAVLIFVLGNFIEVTSTNAGEALAAVKIMYCGGCFISPLFLLFVLDYCEVRIRPPLALSLLAVSSVNLLLVWTTEKTRLIYKTFVFSEDLQTRGLYIIEQGPLYYMFSVIAVICVAAAIIMLVKRFFSWGLRYRRTLILLSLIPIAPLVSNFAYIIATFFSRGGLQGSNLTPVVMVATCTVFYYSVMRYDLFDFNSRAKSLAVDNSDDAVIVLDTELNYSAANVAAIKLFPCLANARKGRPVNVLAGWPTELSEIDASCGDRIERDIEVEVGGVKRYFSASIKPFSSGKRALGVIIITSDTTTNHNLLRELEEAAYTDGLTAIYNRRYFMETASVALQKMKRMKAQCSILIFDIDNFKKVNDTHGHLAGDMVLREVAGVIKNTVRVYDVPARYGGEEFIVLTEGTDTHGASNLAERIRARIESFSMQYEDREINITISAGVSCLRDTDEGIDDILQRSDEALYEAKRQGRNRVCSA
jgi:diguanylate cyclase (GGDEF)-like protein